jgi:hypothetical protein
MTRRQPRKQPKNDLEIAAAAIQRLLDKERHENIANVLRAHNEAMYRILVEFQQRGIIGTAGSE